MAKFSVGKLEEGGSSRRTPKRPRTDGDGATVEEYPPDPDYRQYLSAEYDVFDSDEEEVDQDNNNDGERMQETEQPETQETEKDEDVVSNDDRVAGRDGSAFTVSDLDVLDCFVCYYPLTIPVFQCENGHAACSSCCSRLQNKCPSCCSPIGYNRCRAVEKILESVKGPCKNSKYGCKQIISYSKKLDHEKTCMNEPCSCPILDCKFVASTKQLYKHIIAEHKNSSVEFEYNHATHLSVDIGQKLIVLHEKKDKDLFILQKKSKTVEHKISVTCVAGPWKPKCVFDIVASSKNGDMKVKYQSLANNTVDGKARVDSYIVLSSFYEYLGKIELDLVIWQPHVKQDVL